MYNKINVQRHLEERECPNCGKIWTVWCKKKDTQILIDLNISVKNAKIFYLIGKETK